MSDVVPQIPTLEEYPVSGEPGAVTVQAGGLISTSNVLAGQGQQITAISSALAPNWRGKPRPPTSHSRLVWPARSRRPRSRSRAPPG